MADADAPPMHEDFARWYGVVSLGEDHTRRAARWKGVSSVVKTAVRSTIETLLRLAHRTRQTPTAAEVQAVRQAFKAADDAFEMSGNDRELQVLAGACLTVLMERDEHVGAAAALAATTAGFGGARKPDLPMDLTVLGEIAIDRWSEANRKRPSLGTLDLSGLPKFTFETAAAKAREGFSAESVAAAFAIAADQTRAVIRQIVEQQASRVSKVDRFLRLQDEELQMLWWLTGQRSWDCDRAFDAVPVDLQPLVFASELADNTKFLPGPPSIRAILSRAGLKEHKKVSIAAAVNAADSKWLQSRLAEVDPSPVSTPLHFAIKRQLETGSGDTWVAGWAASTGVNNSFALSALALGNLFYRERLLLLFR